LSDVGLLPGRSGTPLTKLSGISAASSCDRFSLIVFSADIAPPDGIFTVPQLQLRNTHSRRSVSRCTTDEFHESYPSVSISHLVNQSSSSPVTSSLSFSSQDFW